jgi:hypothetical protein
MKTNFNPFNRTMFVAILIFSSIFSVNAQWTDVAAPTTAVECVSTIGYAKNKFYIALMNNSPSQRPAARMLYSNKTNATSWSNIQLFDTDRRFNNFYPMGGDTVATTEAFGGISYSYFNLSQELRRRVMVNGNSPTQIYEQVSQLTKFEDRYMLCGRSSIYPNLNNGRGSSQLGPLQPIDVNLSKASVVFNNKLFVAGANFFYVFRKMPLSYNSRYGVFDYKGNMPSSRDILDLIVHNNKMVIASTDKGLAITSDSGRTIRDINVGLPKITGIRTVASKGGWLYVGFISENSDNLAGIWRSRDDGATWEEFNVGLPSPTTSDGARDINKILFKQDTMTILVSKRFTNSKAMWQIVRDTPTQIKQLAQVSITAYPNPTSGEFSINLPSNLENVTIDVLNSAGQVVLSQNYENQPIKLEQAPGIYMVLIKSDDMIVARTRIIRL